MKTNKINVKDLTTEHFVYSTWHQQYVGITAIEERAGWGIGVLYDQSDSVIYYDPEDELKAKTITD